MKPRFPEPWWWTGSLLLLAALTGVYLFAPTEADPDLWGHLRFGLDLLDNGRMVRPDVYSYMSGGVPWINHEWFTEAIMAIAFRAAGPTGLIALKAGVGLGIGGLLVWRLRRAGLSLLAALLITAYGLAVMLPGFRSVRPQVFTYLCFAITLVVLGEVDAGVLGRRALWILTPVFLLWANLHGGFVAGVGVLLVWMVVGRRWAWWLPVAAAVLATAVNPYGVGLWGFLARTLGPRPDIAEWRAVSLVTREGVAYLAVLAFGALGLAGLVRLRHWPALVLFMGGALLPFIARRHLPLFVLITVVLCAEQAAAAIADFVRRLWPAGSGSSGKSSGVGDGGASGAGGGVAQPSSASSDRFRPVVAGVLVAQALLLLTLSAPHLARIRVNPAEYPIAATARLARSGVRANLVVDFDWGEYVIWHAGPRVKVSVDGRRETVYSDAAYDENMRFTAGADGWDRLLSYRDAENRVPEVALVSVRTRAFDRLVERADWDLLMEDGTSALFGRKHAPVTEAIRATPTPAIEPGRAALFP